MKGHLSFLILCSIVCTIHCLLNTTALSSFKSKDLENPIKVVIDDSGTKFVTWNNISKYEIYDKSGKRRCSGSLSYPIMKAIWPSNYNLLIMTFPGKSIYRIEDEYCKQIKQYNFTDEVHEMSFVWRNQLPILLVSNYKGTFQEFNLNTFSNIKTFLSTAFVVDKAMSTIYSADGSTFYGLQIYNNSLRLEVFDTSLGMGYGALQSSYALTGMTLMKNGKDIMCLATALNGTETDVIRFTTNLNVNTVVERERLSFTIGMREDNHMVLIKSISTEIELINTKDGQTKQNVQYFTNSTFILDGDYKNKIIVLLDDQGNFVTAEYEPTPEPDPVPTPKPQGLPLWEIVTFVVVGLILLTILILFIFRKRLPPKLRNKLPKWFTGEKDTESLLSSREKIEPYFNPEINRPKKDKNEQERYRQPDLVRVSHESHNHIIDDVIANDEPELESEISNRGDVVPEEDAPEISNIGPVEDEDEPDDIRMARLARLNSMNAAVNNDRVVRNEPMRFEEEEEEIPARHDRQSNRNSIPGEYQGEESDDPNYLIVKR